MIYPTLDRILVEEVEDVSSSSLIVVPKNNKDLKKAQVIAVGPGKVSSLTGEPTKVRIQVGSFVYFPMTVGIKINDGAKTYLLIEESSVLAIAVE